MSDSTFENVPSHAFVSVDDDEFLAFVTASGGVVVERIARENALIENAANAEHHDVGDAAEGARLDRDEAALENLREALELYFDGQES